MTAVEDKKLDGAQEKVEPVSLDLLVNSETQTRADLREKAIEEYTGRLRASPGGCWA